MRHYKQIPAEDTQIFLDWLGATQRSMQFIMDQHKNRQYWTEIEPRAWKFSGLSDFHKEIEGKMPAQALKMFKAEDSLESEKRASYISVNKGFP